MLVVLVQMVQMAVQEEALGEDLEVVVVLDQLQVHQHFRWHYSKEQQQVSHPEN